MIIGSDTQLEIGQRVDVNIKGRRISDIYGHYHRNVTFIVKRESNHDEWIKSCEEQAGKEMDEEMKDDRNEKYYYYEIIVD